MSFRYKPHRGGSFSGVDETVRLGSIAELAAHIRSTEPPFFPKFKDEDLSFSPYLGGPEGWTNVHIVSVNGAGPIGYCERPATSATTLKGYLAETATHEQPES